MARRKSWLGWLLLGGDPPPRRKRKARKARTGGSRRRAGRTLGQVIADGKTRKVQRDTERIKAQTRHRKALNGLGAALKDAEAERQRAERLQQQGATRSKTGGPGGTRQSPAKPRTRGFTAPGPATPAEGQPAAPAGGGSGRWICGQPTIEDGSPCRKRGQCPPGTHDPGQRVQSGTHATTGGPYRDRNPTVVLPTDMRGWWNGDRAGR